MRVSFKLSDMSGVVCMFFIRMYVYLLHSLWCLWYVSGLLVGKFTSCVCIVQFECHCM